MPKFDLLTNNVVSMTTKKIKNQMMKAFNYINILK